MNNIWNEIAKFGARNTATKLVLFYFDNMKIKGHEATYIDIAHKLGIASKSVARAVTQLEQMKIIRIYRRQADDHREPNIYWWYDEKPIGKPRLSLSMNPAPTFNVGEV